MKRSAQGTATAAAILAAALVASVAASAPAQASNHPNTERHSSVWTIRAIDSYTALQHNFNLGVAGSSLYLERAPLVAGDNAYSYLWPMREATAATVDLQGIPKVGKQFRAAASDRFASIELYYNVRADGRAGYESYLPAPLGGGGDVFYDDNAVVGLTFFNQFEATRDAAYLEKAKAAFTIVERGWDADPTRACPGGMDWIDTATNTTRGANITGLAAELAAHLYEQTRDDSYLTWATRLFDWNNDCLKQSDGLYLNSRDHDGSINSTLWTYNSGAMIGAATLLYRATNDRSYLGEAKRAADASLAYWTVGDRLQQQPAIFNSIYFKNLLLLDSVSHNPERRATIESYAEQTWQNNRDAATGLFHFQPSGGGDFDPTVRAETLEQSAMIQIFAILAWDSKNYRRIA